MADEVSRLVVKLAFDDAGFSQAVAASKRELASATAEMKLAGAQATAFGTTQDTLAAKAAGLERAVGAQGQVVEQYALKLSASTKKVDELSKTQEELKKQVTDAEAAYKRSAETYGESAAETQRLKAEFEGLSAEYAKNTTALQSNVKTMQTTEAQYTNAEVKLTNLQKQLQATTLELEEHSRGWKKSGEDLQAWGSKADALGTSVAKVGAGLSIGLTAPLGALGASALNVAADFEEAMSGIEAVSGVAGEQKEALRELAIVMGEETKYSALESANAIEELIKAGVSLEDVLNGGLQGSLSLAAAGEIGLADAAEVASTVLNAFRDDNLSVADAADILSGAANASATEVSSMKQGLSQVSAVAAGVGMSFKDTSLALATFAQNGLDGSDAGTSLKTMLSRLSPMTDKAAIQFEKLGLTTEQGTSAFYDATGSLKPLNEIAGLLQKSLTGLTDEQRQLALYTMFGSDAIRGATILYREGAEGVDAMSEAMMQFTAQDVAATRMDNFRGRVEELDGAFETLRINVGTQMLPLAEQGVAALQGVVDWFGNLDEKGQKVALTIGAIAVAAGPLTLIVGGAIKGVGSFATALGALKIQMAANAAAAAASATATGAQAAATGAAGVAAAGAVAPMGAFGTAVQVMTGPIGVAVTVVGLLAAGAAALYHSLSDADSPMEKFKERVEEINEAVSASVAAGDARRAAFADSIEAIQEETTASQRYIEHLEELMAVEAKSDGQKQDIIHTVAELNRLLPEMNLLYDAETDSLNLSTEALRQNNELRALESSYLANEQNYNQAYAEREGIIANMTDAQWAYTEALKEEEGAQAQGLVPYFRRKELIEETQTALQNQTQELAKNLAAGVTAKDAMDQLNESIAEQKNAMEEAAKATEEMSSSTGESMDSMEGAWERYVASLEEGSEEAKKAQKIQEDVYEKIASAAGKMYSKIAEDEAVAMSEMAENLEGNTQKTREWSEGLKTLAEEGVNDGLIKILRDAGPESRLQVQELLRGVGDEAEPAAKKELERLEKAFEESGTASFDALGLALDASAPTALASVTEFTDDAKTGLEDADLPGAFKLEGDNSVLGFVGAVEAGGAKGYTAGFNLAKRTTEGVKAGQNSNSPSKITAGLGGDFGDGYIIGINGKIKGASAAAGSLAGGAISGVKLTQQSNSPAKVSKGLGTDFGWGYEDGIQSRVPYANKAGRKLAEAAAAGVSENSEQVEKALTSLYGKDSEAVDKWLSDKKTKITLSVKEEIALYSELANSNKISAESRTEFQKRSLEASQQYLEEYKETHTVAAQEEIAIWSAVRQKYTVGTKERESADAELLAAQKTYLEELTEDNELSAGDIMRYWDKQRQSYQENTQARIAADQEYKDARADLLKEVESLEQSYIDKVQSLQKQYAGGVFDGMSKSATDSTIWDTRTAMEKQTQDLSAWLDNIGILTERGIDEKFLSELKQMGPDTLEQLQVVVSMSGSELDNYIRMWEEKSRLAKEAALKETEPLREEMEEQIKTLTKGIDLGLEDMSVVSGKQAQKMVSTMVGTLKAGEKDVETAAAALAAAAGRGLTGAKSGVAPGIAELGTRISPTGMPMVSTAAIDMPTLGGEGIATAYSSARDGMNALQSREVAFAAQTQTAAGPRAMTQTTAAEARGESTATTMQFSAGSIVIQLKAEDLSDMQKVIDVFGQLERTAQAKGVR